MTWVFFLKYEVKTVDIRDSLSYLVLTHDCKVKVFVVVQ